MMSKKIQFTIIVILLGYFPVRSQLIPARYMQEAAPGYEEIKAFYQDLAKQYKTASILAYGSTDCGKPLELFVISPEGSFNPDSLRAKGYTILLINNGIHPGEPDGITACMDLAARITSGKLKLPRKVVVCIIPVYNIDGLMVTSAFFRSGQNGPDTVGFRGNAKNLDLNRDFIKCDSENAKSFTRLYRHWDPDVFVDTHVTDGADYQHTMTLIASQKDKLHPDIRSVMVSSLLPFLYDNMSKRGEPMCPYVNVWGDSPEKGYDGFMESPRFASGYSALYHAFPFVTETHMLKPYARRVQATIQFLEVMLQACGELGPALQAARKSATYSAANQQKTFPLSWTIDRSLADTITFEGYATFQQKSRVTDHDLIRFDHNQPYTRRIPFYNHYVPEISIEKPYAYILPQAWKNVTDLILLNKVKYQRLKRDTIMRVPVYYIRDYQTAKTPYEGHYNHSKVKTESDTMDIHFFAGDFVIPCNQPAVRYIIETLEPSSADAFFAWGFFDAIIQQKEWFSDYLFDSDAYELLNSNEALRKEFEAKKQADSTFASDNWAMLSWLYKKSPWYEPSHLRYPVYRLPGPLPAEILLESGQTQP